MADNLDITEGTGTIIGTDEVAGGVHIQKVKLVASTADSVEGLSKAEDSAHTSEHEGIMALTVRQDAAAALGGADADYQPLITDASGRLHIAPLVAGTAAIGKLAANSGVDIGDVTLTAGTASIGKLAANTGVDIGDVDVLSIAAGDNNIGNVDIVTMPADTFAADAQAYGKGILCQGDDGTDRRAILVGTDGHVQVDVLALPASTNTVEVVGDAANNAAIAGNPVAIGVLYDSTKPAVLDDGDVGYALGDSYGRLLEGIEPEWFNAVYDSADATAEGKVVKAGTAAKKIYIMSYDISSDVEGWIKLQDEDSNPLTGKYWLKAGGGIAKTLPKSAPLVLNVVNKALEVICEAAGNISVTVTGYLAP